MNGSHITVAYQDLGAIVILAGSLKYVEHIHYYFHRTEPTSYQNNFFTPVHLTRSWLFRDVIIRSAQCNPQ